MAGISEEDGRLAAMREGRQDGKRKAVAERSDKHRQGNHEERKVRKGQRCPAKRKLCKIAKERTTEIAGSQPLKNKQQ